MGLDEALLESVAAHPESAVLRTYEWDVPTLSLGYFQSVELAGRDPRWSSKPILRRATGGGALWHDREITYAIVVPRSHALARRSSDLYQAIHGLLIAMLRGRGVDAVRRADYETETDATVVSQPGPRPLLCFLDRDPEDILIDGRKVVGSAQRRRSGAVLQHGSILLSQSPTTPELPGIKELAGIDQVGESLGSAVVEALAAGLEMKAFACEVTGEEQHEADRLAQDVYRNAAWTLRR